jgi:hypothetical protein
VAKIEDFLQQLEPRTYTDGELETLATDFGLDGNQRSKVLSHDLKEVKKAVKDEGAQTKGLALRVVM